MKVIKKALASGCVYFTLISIFLLAIQLIFGEATDTTTVTPLRFILIYPYSFLIALGNIVHSDKKINIVLRVLCHYTTVALGFFVLMYIPTATNARGSEILVALFTVTIVYVFGYLIYRLITSVVNSKKNKEKKYDSMFK